MATWYWVASGGTFNLTALASWNAQPDGSGAAPTAVLDGTNAAGEIQDGDTLVYGPWATEKCTVNVTGLTARNVTVDVRRGYTGAIGASGGRLDVKLDGLYYDGNGQGWFSGVTNSTPEIIISNSADTEGAITLSGDLSTSSPTKFQVSGGARVLVENAAGESVEVLGNAELLDEDDGTSTAFGTVEASDAARVKLYKSLTNAYAYGNSQITIEDRNASTIASSLKAYGLGAVINVQSPGTVTAGEVFDGGLITNVGSAYDLTFTAFTKHEGGKVFLLGSGMVTFSAFTRVGGSAKGLSNVNSIAAATNSRPEIVVGPGQRTSGLTV